MDLLKIIKKPTEVRTMKLYKKESRIIERIDQVKCNCCGKTIEKNHLGYSMDYLSVEKRWGYGSSLDGERHSFDLCEECYQKIISAFKIPVDKED